MDPDILNFFAVVMALTVSIAVGGGLFMLINALAKRLKNPSQALPSDEIEDLRARLAALEAQLAQYEDVDERLDFLERVVLALRGGKPVPPGLPPRREKTPV